MKITPALYHTYPAGMLAHIDKDSPVFIEASGCMYSKAYKEFFLHYMSGTNTMLDCGVGMSPDLKNPTAHVSTNPHWAAEYLRLLLEIEPEVVIIPDVLNDGIATYCNFITYSKIIDRLWFSTKHGRRPAWMYVIQGKTKEEAKKQIEHIQNIPYIDYIGFPRIVDYYGEHNGDILGMQRIGFVEIHLESLREAGKQVHLLGMNSIDELKFAAVNNLSIDTRIASMAALIPFDVTKTRPSNLNLDLNCVFSESEIKRTHANVKILNDIYRGHRIYLSKEGRQQHR